MTFDSDFVTSLKDTMIAAISFALESDADADITDFHEVRKVLHTTTYSFTGEFAAGEMFGSFYGQCSCKDGVYTLAQMKFKFGDMDTESIIKCVSNQTLLQGITNAYNVYCTRKEAQPRIYPQLVSLLEKIEKMAPDTKPVTEEIKALFGTDIELVASLPQEKEG